MYFPETLEDKEILKRRNFNVVDILARRNFDIVKSIRMVNCTTLKSIDLIFLDHPVSSK